MDEKRGWLGTVPAMRYERHYGDRIVRCFVERPRSAYELLAEAAARRPDGDALISDHERLSYSAFDSAVQRCASGLVAAGVEKGDRVGLLLGNGLAFPVILFAAFRIGAIAVPISVREHSAGVRYILGHCGARLLAYDRDLEDRLPRSGEAPAEMVRLAIDAAAPLSLMSACADGVGGDDGNLVADVDEEDTAMILYTSGTTGRAKGAMVTHLGLCHSAMHYETAMGLTERDRAVAAVPFSHVTGIVGVIAAIVRAHGAIIVLSVFKACDFLELAAREGMTHSLMVPAMYELCLREAGFEAASLAGWRIGGYGGAAMASSTIARFAEMLPGLKLMNVYGATETTSPVTVMPPGETATRPDSVGCALPLADVLVVDEHGLEVAPGEAGELWLGGPMVVPGYWGDKQATHENFVGGFWRSGDIGSKDGAGFVRVLDRKKDMINRGGYKVYSLEVENALMSCPGVVEAAVVATPCEVLGERVHAFVVTNRELKCNILKSHCAGLLADYKVPDVFTLLERPLPRNANGKLLKRDLKAETK